MSGDRPQSCSHDIERLRALVEGRLSERNAAKVREQLDTCDSCAARLERLEAIRGTLADLGDAEPPDDINFRLVEAQVRWRLSRDEREGEERSRGGFAAALKLLLRPAMVYGLLILGVGVAVGALIERSRHEAPQPGASAKAKGPGTTSTSAAAVAKAATTNDSGATAVGHETAAALPTLLGGDVRVVDSDGRTRVLTLARPVLPGETVVTGKDGRAALQWSSGRGVRLQPRTRVTLATLTYKAQHLRLVYGRVDLEIAPAQPDGNAAAAAGNRAAPPRGVHVIAGALRASVRGTRFAVERDDTRATLTVYRGLVRATPTGSPWSRLSKPSDDDASHQLTAGSVDVRAGYRLEVVGAGQPRLSRLPVGSSAKALARGAKGKTGAKAAPKNGRSQLGFNLLEWQGLAAVLASSGTLAVVTRPIGADLSLDSVPVGPTNIRLRVRLGRHLVELWRDGKLVKRRWVDVGGAMLGTTAATVDLDMIPKVPARRGPRVPPVILKLMRMRSPQIRPCYERRLKVNDKLKGKLTLRMSIGDDGKVAAVKVMRDTVHDALVARCAAAVISRWTFPRGNASTVVFPLVFRPN